MTLPLYDQKGRLFVRGFPYYKDTHGNLLRVPSMFDSKENIMKYLEICFRTSVDPIKERLEISEGEIVEILEEFWERGEEKTKKILEMLSRRAEELKKEGSIRHLLYTKTREILSRLNIPIFNVQQLSNIPNMNRVIINEAGLILDE